MTSLAKELLAEFLGKFAEACQCVQMSFFFQLERSGGNKPGLGHSVLFFNPRDVVLIGRDGFVFSFFFVWFSGQAF